MKGQEIVALYPPIIGRFRQQVGLAKEIIKKYPPILDGSKQVQDYSIVLNGFEYGTVRKIKGDQIISQLGIDEDESDGLQRLVFNTSLGGNSMLESSNYVLQVDRPNLRNGDDHINYSVYSAYGNFILETFTTLVGNKIICNKRMHYRPQNKAIPLTYYNPAEKGIDGRDAATRKILDFSEFYVLAPGSSDRQESRQREEARGLSMRKIPIE